MNVSSYSIKFGVDRKQLHCDFSWNKNVPCDSVVFNVGDIVPQGAILCVVGAIFVIYEIWGRFLHV